ncbi:fumarylacetoacetase [Rhizobium sp. NPDC090279]|uniref:fumarylacetoacetase n=1 Tax=Rhizobium sp. NPDC090279 TaxID=3364499 RepID=UPI00383B961F
MLNETHDPLLRSWVESANAPDGDFPIQNLPHGIFRRRGSREAYRGGIAIGDHILDMAAASTTGLFAGAAQHAAELAGAQKLNELMAAGPGAWSALRLALSRMLRRGSPQADKMRRFLVPQADAEHAVPAEIGDFTDFFTSWDHMINGGKVFAPGNPPLPNFKSLPLGYHSRSSSVVISGTPLRRPSGQTRIPGQNEIVFGPSRWLDHELELGIFVGPGNDLGQPIPIDEAEDHLFGLCLLNDWSARDIQAWESMPLGPFLAKSFLTTLSPWIVTMEALAPFRAPLSRLPDDPEPFSYLRGIRFPVSGLDIALEAMIETKKSVGRPVRISHCNYGTAYWAPAHLVTHHTSNGCNLRPGDLLGTGTQSGEGSDEWGSMLEISQGAKRPLMLADGETRTFLEDGDTIIFKGRCIREGFVGIGFGECSGTILPAAGA